MGRGRAKAKQTKVARRLKYSSPHMDLDALRQELASGPGSGLYETDEAYEGAYDDQYDDVDESDDDDDLYAKYADDDEDEDEDDEPFAGR